MRIIAAVVSMLSTIFVAVPALSRVDPAITSGPTAGAGADEKHASLLPQRLRDDVDADRDALLLAADRVEHLAVLVQHPFDDVGGGELVDRERRRVDLLGGKRLPFRTDRHANQDLRNNPRILS